MTDLSDAPVNRLERRKQRTRAALIRAAQAFIAEGKVNAFYAERVLMEQFHVKTDDYGKNAKIADVLKAAGVTKVTDMVIMKVGG